MHTPTRVIFRVRIRWLVRLLITVVAVVRAVPAKARGRAAASVAVVRAKVVRAVRVPASGATTVRVRAGGSQGAGQGGARGGFRGGQGGGNNFQGGGAPSNGPARGGGRGGRGGAAGAFGRQGGKSSKARKNRLAKRHEYEELKAPTIGGVRIPNGNGQTIRLRQGRVPGRFGGEDQRQPGRAGHRALPPGSDGYRHPVLG